MRLGMLIMGVILAGTSCQNDQGLEKELPQMELVLVDSLTTDILKPLNLIDFHKEKGLYLMSTMGLEGTYYILDKKGNIVVENSLAEGPNGFGMVLLRAGFVGDDVVLVGMDQVHVYDLDLQKQRSYPFEQEPRFKVIHFVRDYLSTFNLDEQEWPIVNLNEAILHQYPRDYFDTLNMVHLINPQNGEVKKGGKLDPSSRFSQDRFYPYLDKPLHFSDGTSSVVSVILGADSVLYQYDPNRDFELVNRITVPRLTPDVLNSIPMEEASRENLQNNRPSLAFSGNFHNMMGTGDTFLLAYRTGGEKGLWSEQMDEASRDKFNASVRRYYIPIKEGELAGKPMLWEKPGELALAVGENRFIHYHRDQAELHEYEKEYQCYYIYELRRKGE
ncbi:hypothetical protein [Pleomorphovibrio marinus]|uniref:hypothetical protein n=1 Tax=Pleomorphovibrio marinus TaxID=2164132 RepID=UPI000E0C3A57|nr:hypothetical protein [Pleomorphovibrio marinus]